MFKVRKRLKFCLKMRSLIVVCIASIQTISTQCKAESYKAPEFFYKIYESNQSQPDYTQAQTQGLASGVQNREQLERWAGKTGQQFFNWVRSNGSSLGTKVNQVEDFFKFQPQLKTAQNQKEPVRNIPAATHKENTRHKFNLRILNLTGQAVATYSGWFNSRLSIDPSSQSLQVTTDHAFAHSVQLSVQNLWNRHESRNSILLRYGF